MPDKGQKTWVGQPLRRKEERRLVTGRGKFVDDFKPDRCLHVCLVRSPYAHAHIDKVDVSAAEALPGVVATLTSDEVAKLCQPFFPIGPDPCTKIVDLPMAHQKARYQLQRFLGCGKPNPRRRLPCFLLH